jgi:hypothetical protein
MRRFAAFASDAVPRCLCQELARCSGRAIDAFKAMELRSEPPSPAERVFMTSGTGRAARGRHFHPQLDVYDLSMKRYFSGRFMQGLERMPMGILFPDEQAMPNSSLAHYLALARSNSARRQPLLSELGRAGHAGPVRPRWKSPSAAASPCWARASAWSM